LKPLQGLGVAERHGRLEVVAVLHVGKVEHRVDQAGSAARREVSGVRVQLGSHWLSATAECVHLGEHDNVITVGDLDALVLVLDSHDASTSDLDE
jgi:hypothetical protein